MQDIDSSKSCSPDGISLKNEKSRNEKMCF